jgi:hypothetical protein
MNLAGWRKVAAIFMSDSRVSNWEWKLERGMEKLTGHAAYNLLVHSDTTLYVTHMYDG